VSGLADVVGHEGGRQLVDALVAEALGPEERARLLGEQAGDVVWVRALHGRSSPLLRAPHSGPARVRSPHPDRVNGAESSQEDDAVPLAGCWTAPRTSAQRGRLTGVSVLMLAVVALLPTCLLGILALTSRLEGWLARADLSATEPGELRGAHDPPRDR
jgi:hypothetical protein